MDNAFIDDGGGRDHGSVAVSSKEVYVRMN